MITLSNISHEIAGSPILTDISVNIPKGQLTALIGANGAGKSTLLSLISRLIPLQKGQIICGDLDITKATSMVLARKVSVLRQSNDIASRLRVRDLVSFGRYPYHQGQPLPLDWEKVDHALELFELDALKHRFLDQLSGGQRQRALVAMIYCQETEYMLLDEPLNSLDLYHARNLMRLLSNLTKSEARTIVVVLHDINYAATHADNIIALKGGKMVAQGPMDEIFCNDVLSEVFGTAIEVSNLDGRKIALHH